MEVSYRLGRRIAEVSRHRPGLEWYERLLAG
jgi:hypothetical protein